MYLGWNIAFSSVPVPHFLLYTWFVFFHSLTHVLELFDRFETLIVASGGQKERFPVRDRP